MTIKTFEQVKQGKLNDKFRIDFLSTHYRSLYSCVIYYKDKEIFSQGVWNRENLPEEIRDILDLNIDHVVDYLWYLDEPNYLFFKNGSVKKGWFTSLFHRIKYDGYSFETTKRMNIFISRMDEIKNRLGFNDFNVDAPDFIKSIYRYLKIDPVENKSIYRCDAFTKHHSEYSFYSEKNLEIHYEYVVSSYKNFHNHLGLSFCYNREKVVEWTSVGGTEIPSMFLEELLNREIVAKCNTCGNYFQEANVFDGECAHCSGVHPEDLELKSYSTKATEYFAFKIHKKNPLPKSKVKFLGVELEYDCFGKVKEGAKFSVKKLKSHAILKRDGSVSNGLEIVTAPADIQTQKEEFESFFKDLEYSVLKATKDTGMHIHVDKGFPIEDYDGNKKSFSKMSYLTLGKIVHFMQKKENASFIKFIGERESSYAKIGTGDSIVSAFVEGEHERYKGLNLKNKSTIEFRIFATPMKYENFCKNLEFVDAITDFCSHGNSGISQLNSECFIKFTNDRKSAYPNLVKFLKGYNND